MDIFRVPIKTARSLHALAAGLLLGSMQAAAGAEPVSALVDKYACMNCHGPVHRQVGPGFAQVADRYRADPKAATYLAGRLRNGAVGNWGRLVMPRQPHMTEDEALLLARWVLDRPSR
ncbi:c-type cytochrome [Xylophilus sp. GOD-11R]|uniref:c-type cytochrome n=1 Tax=Xylophilus sp. GOD-11R TaxID=3089814 RepID=UPI00298D22B6|nr:c-type cytochrome [Xylophilus sp. GOD-11R]WPB58813.1 c-type cytochrome [Xylophilus sp. GOD-11R]